MMASEIVSGAPLVMANAIVRGGGRPARYKLASGDVVPGTTTIISRFKDSGGLLRWAHNLGLEGKSMDAARDKAADAGTLAHDMIESHIHGEVYEPAVGTAAAIVDWAHTALGNFITWSQQTNLIVTATELPLLSERHRFGGCIDAIGEVSGKACLVDWKTSNAVYSDYIVQVSAYVYLYEENHPDQHLQGVHLLRYDKEFASFSHHYWGRNVVDLGWEYFLHARAMFDLDKKLKKAAA
jgi:hypothetical protein